jgi:hypothetical protein
MATTLRANGVDRTVDVDGGALLIWLSRDALGVTGAKFSCGLPLRVAARRLPGARSRTSPWRRAIPEGADDGEERLADRTMGRLASREQWEYRVTEGR